MTGKKIKLFNYVIITTNVGKTRTPKMTCTQTKKSRGMKKQCIRRKKNCLLIGIG